MSIFSLPALGAAALLCAAAVIPFLPAARLHSEPFYFEVRLNSTRAGNVQIYYDSGPGYREADSSTLPLAADREALYRLPLPQGAYLSFRFDPIDRDGTVTVEEPPRIVDSKGALVRTIDYSALTPLHQIQSLEEKDGRLAIVVEPGADDPNLKVNFDKPISLRVSRLAIASKWLGDWLRRAPIAFAVLAALLLAADRAERPRRALLGALRRLIARPPLAVAAVAAVAVAASAYPVIFLGKSYVSPNYGTTLLYDGYPTLPGSHDAVFTDPKASDVGAMLWQFVAYSSIQHRSILRDREWPVWNRYNSLGVPLLGQGFSKFGDPLNLIPILTGGQAWAWDLEFLAAKWLFALALGLLVLAVSRHTPAALIVTLAAPFLGFFVYRLNHPAFFTVCYAPWILLCWLGAARSATPRAFAGWAAGAILANFAVMNSGTVKEAYMLIFALNFSGLCALLAGEAPWRTRLLKLLGMAWAGALFALISAPFWATFAETLSRAYTSYNDPGAFQLRPALLLGAFDEAFYRPLRRAQTVFNPAVNFLILAGLLYFLATLRGHFRDRVLMALAASSLVPLAIAFGLAPPSWIVAMPFLGNVGHIDNTFSCALLILWSVLAGAGFASAARRLGTPEGRGDLAIAGLLLFALVFDFIAFWQVVIRTIFSDDATIVPLHFKESVPVSPFLWGYLASLLVATVALGLLARRCLARGRASSAACLGFALCGCVLLWRQGFQAPAAGFENYVVRPADRADFHARSGAVRVMQDGQKEDPSRGIGLQGNFFPGWTGVYGLESIDGPDPLINPRYRELAEASPLTRMWDWRLYLTRDNLAASRPFLDFLNVRYYFDLKSDQRQLGAVLKLVRTGDLDVYESPTCWPRAFFTDRLAIAGSAGDLMRLIAGGDGRPFASAEPSEIVGIPAFAAMPEGTAGRTVVPATGYRLTENSTSFEIQAPGPGLAVLDEAWWPGYPHAELDGRPVHLLRVNWVFCAVSIPAAGRHRIKITYQPKDFSLLLVLSGAGLALLAGSLGLACRRKTE